MPGDVFILTRAECIAVFIYSKAKVFSPDTRTALFDRSAGMHAVLGIRTGTN